MKSKLMHNALYILLYTNSIMVHAWGLKVGLKILIKKINIFVFMYYNVFLYIYIYTVLL